MFPKTGKVFPSSKDQQDSMDYAPMIALALQKQLGNSHQAIKTTMRWTGARERTVKNWFSGTHGPSGGHLIALARNSDEVLDIFLMMTGHRALLARANIVESITKLTDALEFMKLLQTKGQL
jgi:hypothetical protein